MPTSPILQLKISETKKRLSKPIFNEFNETADAVEKGCVQLVRDRIGPVAAFKLAIVVPRLPKTRSGKILRGTIKKIADRTPWTMPATIDDPAVLDEITASLRAKGILA